MRGRRVVSSSSVFAAQENEARGYGEGNERRGTKVEKAGEMAGTATAQEQLPVFSSQAGYLYLFGLPWRPCSGRNMSLPSCVGVAHHHVVGTTFTEVLRTYSNYAKSIVSTLSMTRRSARGYRNIS